MSQFTKDFKEFIARGNVMDMAVGVIIGGAFGKIVASLVNDVIMPVVGKAMGGVDFKDILIALDGKEYQTLQQAKDAGAPVIAIGSFFQNVIDFLIIALVVFIMIRQIGRITSRFKKEEIADPTTKICPFCKSEIDIEATRCPHCTSELN